MGRRVGRAGLAARPVRLAEELASLLRSGDHSDLQVTVEDEVFQTHTMILKLRSPFFAAKLSPTWVASGSGEGTCVRGVATRSGDDAPSCGGVTRAAATSPAPPDAARFLRTGAVLLRCKEATARPLPLGS